MKRGLDGLEGQRATQPVHSPASPRNIVQAGPRRRDEITDGALMLRIVAFFVLATAGRKRHLAAKTPGPSQEPLRLISEHRHLSIIEPKGPRPKWPHN